MLKHTISQEHTLFWYHSLRTLIYAWSSTTHAYKIQVKLCCVKHMCLMRHNLTFTFIADIAPDGLLFHSKNRQTPYTLAPLTSDAKVRNRFRVYKMVSMDVETYNLSRTYLFWYHTLRTLIYAWRSTTHAYQIQVKLCRVKHICLTRHNSCAHMSSQFHRIKHICLMWHNSHA
jgi:hypothetical protein